MSTSSGTPETWISSFCSLLGHEYFAEVSEDFIEDDFNLTGLQSQVGLYKEALEMILDVEPEEDEDEEDEDEEEEENESGDDRTRGTAGGVGGGAPGVSERRHHARMPSDLSMIEGSAELLYGLIHQRFICSRAGIQQMSEKYELSHFGVCPRTYCNLARTLPVGLSDIPGEDTVKLFCPSCLDVYVPPNSRFQTVDGAFFGRTFGALFLLTYPEYDLSKNGVEALTNLVHDGTGPGGTGSLMVNGVYARNTAPGLGRGKIFEPKIYGFRVSELARSGPRMQWLRNKPDAPTDLDEATRYAIEHADSLDDDYNDDDDDGIIDGDDDGGDEDESMISGSTGVHSASVVTSTTRRTAAVASATATTRYRQQQLPTQRQQQSQAQPPQSSARLRQQQAQSSQRQHQNGSPMTVDANGAEAGL